MKKNITAFALACLLTVGLAGCTTIQEWFEDTGDADSHITHQSVIT